MLDQVDAGCGSCAWPDLPAAAPLDVCARSSFASICMDFRRIYGSCIGIYLANLDLIYSELEFQNWI